MHSLHAWLLVVGSDKNMHTRAGIKQADHFSSAIQSNCWAKTKCLPISLSSLIWIDTSCFTFKSDILRQSIQTILSTTRIFVFSKEFCFGHHQPGFFSNCIKQLVSVLEICSQSWSLVWADSVGLLPYIRQYLHMKQLFLKMQVFSSLSLFDAKLAYCIIQLCWISCLAKYGNIINSLIFFIMYYFNSGNGISVWFKIKRFSNMHSIFPGRFWTSNPEIQCFSVTDLPVGWNIMFPNQTLLSYSKHRLWKLVHFDKCAENHVLSNPMRSNIK